MSSKRFSLVLIIFVSLLGSLVPVSNAAMLASVSPQVDIQRACDESEAELTIRILIPKGTTLDTESSVIEQLLKFFKEVWLGSDPIFNNIVPLNPRNPNSTDPSSGARSVLGVDAVMSVTRAYRQIESRGLLAFPSDVTVISKEKFPVNIDCLIQKSPTASVSSPESRIKQTEDTNRLQLKRKQLTSNLNNIAVSLVSFRSQYNRFPRDLTELNKSGHYLVSLTNPYRKTPLSLKSENGPGSVSYSSPSQGRYILKMFDEKNTPIQRELYIGSEVSTKGTLSINKPAASNSALFNHKEQIVRVYIFQISQLLNSFYEINRYLPKSISHLEAQGFASLNFTNPYTGKLIQPVSKIDHGSPGGYWYSDLGDGEFLLIGYGENGREVINIHGTYFSSSKRAAN